VDEVLAVGDTEFQKKCLGKMNDIAGQGRTVIFVSHSMEAVKSLCTRGILFKDGRIAMDGSVADVIAHYLGTDKHG
jgi:lipopolysaccharide transport system ATP-binding protein